MSHLSEKISRLQGDLTQEQMAKRCGVSRNVFSYLAKGQSVKLSTLRKIANAFQLSRTAWLDLLIAWIRAEIGEDDFRELVVRRSETAHEGDLLHDAEQKQEESLLKHFSLLSESEQEEIMKTMQRQEVLNCLPSINRVWDRFEAPKKQPKRRRKP